MDEIARIPELPPPVVSAQVTPAAPRRDPAGRRRRVGFPGYSVVALAAIAAAVWFLAAWQEHERLARQRRLFRLAQQPAANARESIAK